MMANGLVALLSVGLVAYSHLMIKPEPISDREEFQKLKRTAAESVQVRAVTFKKLTVNLYSRKTRLRYLDVEMNLLPFKESYREIFITHQPMISDIVIDVAGNMSPEELNSLAGRMVFESRIKEAVKTVFGASLIQDIFFTKFVIQ